MPAKFKIDFNIRQLKKKIRDSNRDPLYRAGGIIRTIAQRSIKRSDHPSKPGKPPHTRKSPAVAYLKKSIIFSVDRQQQAVFVGPSRSIIGLIGSVHEHGLNYKGQQFDKRPFMGPAFDIALPKIREFWKDVL